jgi:hypothetical protein
MQGVTNKERPIQRDVSAVRDDKSDKGHAVQPLVSSRPIQRDVSAVRDV